MLFNVRRVDMMLSSEDIRHRFVGTRSTVGLTMVRRWLVSSARWRPRPWPQRPRRSDPSWMFFMGLLIRKQVLHGCLTDSARGLHIQSIQTQLQMSSRNCQHLPGPCANSSNDCLSVALYLSQTHRMVVALVR